MMFTKLMFFVMLWIFMPAKSIQSNLANKIRAATSFNHRVSSSVIEFHKETTEKPQAEVEKQNFQEKKFLLIKIPPNNRPTLLWDPAHQKENKVSFEIEDSLKRFWKKKFQSKYFYLQSDCSFSNNFIPFFGE